MTYSAVVCSGSITFDGAGVAQCSTGWTVQVVAQPFDPATLDPQMIAGAVGVGFFILVPLWAAALGVRSLIKIIR